MKKKIRHLGELFIDPDLSGVDTRDLKIRLSMSDIFCDSREDGIYLLYDYIEIPDQRPKRKILPFKRKL